MGYNRAQTQPLKGGPKMSDETSLAFELPHIRSLATSGPDPLDRISVRDYTRDVEIGAFQAERGVTQRIRFNVVLEVSRHAAAQSDDVDKVLSYDTITEAIDAQLSNERINLLETLPNGWPNGFWIIPKRCGSSCGLKSWIASPAR